MIEPDAVQHRSAALRFFVMLAMTAAATFAIAALVVLVTAIAVERITVSHRVTLESVDYAVRPH